MKPAQTPAATMNIASLRTAYQTGQLTPTQVMQSIRASAADLVDYNIWIHQLTEQEQAAFLDRLDNKDVEQYPLWGIPFAIKDNIDLAGIPTTAACAEFTYTPTKSAKAVEQLIDAGAIPVGKTNLDQFATGLNGTRSPWGACRNAIVPEYISGGSSSGSAVAVALGLASFALGTDTAGSGRVPASFNSLTGMKPTRGIVSSSGMVPACRSLDCMSIFTHNADDANLVLSLAEGYDSTSPYSRHNPFSNQTRQYGERVGKLKLGVPAQEHLEFFGDEHYANVYQRTLDALAKNNIDCVEIDFAPFLEAGRLLYEGPWVAERYIAIEQVIKQHPQTIVPVVHDIIAPGSKPRATDLFRAQYHLQELKQHCLEQLAELDGILTPTAGTCFTITDMLEQPVVRNSQLGYYTNFMNLLDLAAVAVPTQYADNGLPFGVTLAAPAFQDRALLAIARRFERLFHPFMGDKDGVPSQSATARVGESNTIDIAVCGAHLEGMTLHWQLAERGARRKARTHTAPIYRMYVLAGGPPWRPGLIQDQEQGAAIEIEIWSVPASEFGSFVDAVPGPLGIGKLLTADGTRVSGFICEPYGIAGAQEITHLGSWREYVQQLAEKKL